MVMALLQVSVLLAWIWKAKADCYTAAFLDRLEFPSCAEVKESNLWVAWHVNDATIDIAIARKGLGWVGVGIAEEQNGGMRGADMIVASKVDDSLVLEDRFAEGFWHPLKDDHQDVELVSSGEINGVFQVVVRRPIRSCDPQDRSIRPDYTHRLIYAYGDDDWTFNYHGTSNRGSVQIYFGNDTEKRNAMYDEALSDNSFDHMRIQFQNYHIPTQDRPTYSGKWVEGTNQYKCLAVPLAEVTNLTPPFDIIGGTPIVTSKYLHHFVNSACVRDPRPNPGLAWGQDLDNDIFNCAMAGSSAADCVNIPGWAQGGGGFRAPADTGIRIVESTSWIVFDTHYYNPTMDKMAFDSSGYDYMVTKQLRQLTQGTMWLGIDFSMRLPFGQNKVDFAQHCPAEAVEHLFPEGQDFVQLLGLNHHLHMRGRGARTYIVRDGRRIPLVLQDYYDYNFQATTPVNLTLRRGDALEVHCTFDTSADTSDIRWGERTQDEMCISIVAFSPAPRKATMFRCLSTTVESPLGNGKFTTIDWDGMEEELKLKFDYQGEHQKPSFVVASGCVKPPDKCPAYMWNLCKACAVCFTSEICEPSGCMSEKPAGCEQCSPCASCFEPSGSHCESCDNTCEPYLHEVPGYVWNSTELRMNVGYPVPDANGKYDLPWGKPLSSTFADYECQEVGFSSSNKKLATKKGKKINKSKKAKKARKSNKRKSTRHAKRTKRTTKRTTMKRVKRGKGSQP